MKKYPNYLSFKNSDELKEMLTILADGQPVGTMVREWLEVLAPALLAQREANANNAEIRLVSKETEAFTILNMVKSEVK